MLTAAAATPLIHVVLVGLGTEYMRQSSSPGVRLDRWVAPVNPARADHTPGHEKRNRRNTGDTAHRFLRGGGIEIKNSNGGCGLSWLRSQSLRLKETG